MANHKTKLELTWVGKENLPRLEPRILMEVPGKSATVAVMSLPTFSVPIPDWAVSRDYRGWEDDLRIT